MHEFNTIETLPSSLKLQALTEPSCPLEKVIGPCVLYDDKDNIWALKIVRDCGH